MKLRTFLPILCLLSIPAVVRALPQDFGDLSDLFQGGLAMDNRDLTPQFVAPALWQDGAELPGEWKDADKNGARLVRHLAAAPVLFGERPIAAEAIYEGEALEQVSIYYLEVGTYFGYRPGLRDTVAGQKTAQEKQRLFRKAFREVEKKLTKSLEEATDDRGETRTEGKTSLLKTRFRQFAKDGVAFQLRAKKDYFVRVDLRPEASVRQSLMDAELEAQKKRERVAQVKEKVVVDPTGDVWIDDVPMIYQGGRAYCGVTTFLMGAQHLGVRVDPATLASVAGFKYGQGGKKMIEAYNAVAKEGDLRLKRATKVDGERVRKSVESGLPVVVWRRFDRERNRLHARAARSPGRLPEPSDTDRASWPGAEAPAHASLVTGINPGTNEVIFAESWGEHARGKRMRMEELEATAYYVFYFTL